MCKFLSAIVLENGDIICDPEHTDSHEDLMVAANIRDGHTQLGRFARVEFLPPEDETQIANPDAWRLVLDEQNAPEWWDVDVVRGKLERLVARQIVNDKRPLLLGGWWILVSGADVGAAKHVRIVAMRGSSQVGAMWGSSRVDEMYDSSQVNAMQDSSRVDAMYGSSRVRTMWGSSQVGKMCDSSQVGEMYGLSRIVAMWTSSQVGTMQDSSRVGEMWGSSRVDEMYGLSQVDVMYDNARIVQDNRN